MHPQITDTALLGVPARGGSAGEEGNEVPKAYVVLRKGSKLTEKEV